MVAGVPLDKPIDSLETPDRRSERPTLLIVDDEEGPRQSLRVVFKDEYNLLMASDGAAALELVRNNRIDVAVLDIRMAGLSGIEVLEKLKQIDPGVEVVMMTAFETADTIRQALRLRACDYINKPFDLATMRNAVGTALERRRLGRELKANAGRLQELQGELQRQKLEEEIVRTRGEIYASIIHDINGPLTIISGLIQIINQRIGEESQVEGEDLEMVKDRLKRITRQVTNCIEISRRYLSFLRQNPNENVRVWVNQILGDLGELLRVHPTTRNNQLLIHPLPEDVSVPVNGTDLIQILLNLTLNALQCTTAPHRVEISGQLLHQPLDLGHFQDGPEDRFLHRDTFRNTPPILALAVQDNGPGMPPDLMSRIFEPFLSKQYKTHGTGLGLCIVNRLLKEAHGSLHTHTRIGQGSAFTIYLPARLTGSDPTFKL